MREIKIIIPDLDEMLPDEFVEHMSRAAKEFLLAMKSLVDAGIERIEKVEEEIKAAREVKKIEIE